ncbi:MAG: hypothetical protein WB615_11210 [Candidatus Tumulicola sp.]
MLAILSIIVLIAQTNAQPSPTVTLSPEWKVAPLEMTETSAYSRKEADGSETSISLARDVCDCDPAHRIGMIQSMFQLVPGAVVAKSAVQACGEQAHRVIVTGRNTPSNPEANNLEIIEFRKGAALYTLAYSFLTPAPLPDAEAALMTLCPT